jgi:hypothetical protein
MLVKTQHNLMPAEMKAHTVVIEDDMKNPIFVATHVADGIMYSAVGDSDFATVLKMANVDTPPPTVHEVPPPPKQI